MDSHLYYAFGLKIESVLELPGLQNSYDTEHDLTITEGHVPDHLVNGIEYQGNFQYTENDFLFKSKNSGKFLVKNSNKIIFEKYDNSTYEDIKALLLSVVLGIILHKKEKFPLHASAILYNGKAILFSGQCGAGKSTIATAFIKHGAGLISDDITVIDPSCDNFFAIPSFSQIKLWPDSIQALGFNPANFERFRPKIEKRKLIIENAQKERHEIRAIYFLKKNNMNKHTIEEMSIKSKITMLEKNTFRIRHMKQIGNNQKHFEICCALTKKIPMKILTFPQDKFMLDKTINMVFEDLKEIQ
jgi:hypothetical protein